jgi:hypothetical protein
MTVVPLWHTQPHCFHPKNRTEAQKLTEKVLTD